MNEDGERKSKIYIYMLTKYIKRVLWGLTVCLSYIQDAWCLKFKYLEYRISEYKSYLEDKLETYNKINGAIRRHFGKQTNKETKLRIHKITAKAALKFGIEAGVLKKREEQRLEAARMKFLRHLE